MIFQVDNALRKGFAIMGLSAALCAGAQAAWPVRYDGPPDKNDEAIAVGLDSAGNVFVAGTSEGAGTGNDITLISYHQNGTLRSLNRYAGAGGSDEMALSMKVDGSGNVYVCGVSNQNGTGDDVITIKYNNGGTRDWVKFWNGPAGSHDVGTSIDVDSAGNVFVGGYSQNDDGSRDFIAIKYGPGGGQQWVKRYLSAGTESDEATKIVVDQATGDVYIAGNSVGAFNDYLTVKFANNGAFKWARRYDGIGGDDMVTGLQLDSAGNVVVGGSSVGSSFTMDYLIVKYDANGTVQWIKRHQTLGEDLATALKVDASDNVIITGSSGKDVELMDFMTVKYNSSGTFQWVAKYTGHNISGGSNDGATAVTTDAAGNVYVTGYAQGDGTTFDYNYKTIVYNSSGARIKLKTYNGPEGLDDMASSIAVHTNGRIYVAGKSGTTASFNDFATDRYLP